MKYLGQIMKEVIPVIIGILIALFINNWNEERKEKDYLDQIFTSIENELEESLVDIKNVMPKQIASIDTIGKYLNEDDVTLYEVMMRGNGIHIPTIRTNAWKAIANSKIELVDYEKLSTLADIQERKENLMLRVERQMDFTFQNFEKTDKKKKIILRMIIGDIIGAEKELQEMIEDLLKK